MNVKVTCIKGVVWVLSIIGTYHVEKWYDRNRALIRARLLAGMSGKVILV
jgi:hypothetical protein